MTSRRFKKVYTVKLLLEAEIEVADACQWYEKRKPGLGRTFLTNLTIALIA